MCLCFCIGAFSQTPPHLIFEVLRLPDTFMGVSHSGDVARSR